YGMPAEIECVRRPRAASEDQAAGATAGKFGVVRYDRVRLRALPLHSCDRGWLMLHEVMILPRTQSTARGIVRCEKAFKRMRHAAALMALSCALAFSPGMPRQPLPCRQRVEMAPRLQYRLPCSTGSILKSDAAHETRKPVALRSGKGACAGSAVCAAAMLIRAAP
ncbi:MAG: hypothetical protein ACPIOQ_69255, partial [Promethearchaeia archaeon]